jgi:hypothetical protein
MEFESWSRTVGINFRHFQTAQANDQITRSQKGSDVGLCELTVRLRIVTATSGWFNGRRNRFN